MGHEHKNCGHHHHHHHHGDQKNILTAFILNFCFAIIELIGGYYTNSVAIMSDALHDFGDSLAMLFSYFAEKLKNKKADSNFTFGYRRFSVLSAFISGIILISGSLYVIGMAISRIENPETVKPEGMVLLAILGIAVNGYSAFKMSKNMSLNSKMIYYHLLEDLLGWVAVLIVSVILLFKPWYILDSLLSIVISLIILRGVLRNFFKIGSIFLQKFPEGLDKEELINIIRKLELVQDVHFIQGWSLDESKFSVTLHIKVSPDLTMREVDSLRLKIESLFKEKNIIYSSIQFEGDGCGATFTPTFKKI